MIIINLLLNCRLIVVNAAVKNLLGSADTLYEPKK